MAANPALDPVRMLQVLTRRRRLVAATLAGVAVICGLSALRPAVPATVPIWSAARDLTGGAPLGERDVVAERLPAADVPAGAMVATRPITGRILAAPVRRGEPLTDVRLLSTTLLSSLGTPGLVAVPVRVADGPATSAIVAPGDRVDILAAGDALNAGTAVTRVVVRAVRVIAVPATADEGSGDTGGLLVVAATTDQAADLARAATGARLSVAVRGDAR